MARPRTPTAILELRGAFDHDPQRRRPDEPVPDGEIGAAPNYLNARETRVYNEIVEAAPGGVLTSADQLLVVAAARLEAEWRANPKDFTTAKIGQLLRAYSHMGLTPADRSRIAVKKDDKKKNKFDDV